MSSSNYPRVRTHTLPDDRALFLLGRVPRRRSVSSLPAAATAASRRRTPSASGPSVAPPTSSTSASPSLLPPPARRPLAVATAATAPTTPSAQSPAPPTIGPWSGTFLDAGPDADADSDDADDDNDDYYDAPEPDSDSDVNPISASLPELRQRNSTRSQSVSQPSPLQTSQEAKALPHPPPQDQAPAFLPPPPLPSNNVRDSIISILDDPFFQRYHTPSTDWFSDDGPLPGPSTPSLPPDPAVIASAFAAASSRAGTDAASGTDNTILDDKDKSRDDKSARPPPRRESLTVTDQGLWPPPPKKMTTVNIAVIGADGAGKSSFIQRAMRLPKLPTTGISGMRIDVDGKPFIVTMIELDLEHFDVDANLKIRWPKNISGNTVPHVDGALMLYDVMNKDSIRNLPPTLAALHNSSLPTILVATKCDNPESSRQINADALATVFPSILTNFKTSANVPGNTRDCLQAIVLAAVYNRKGGPTNPNDRESYYRSQNSRSPRVEYPNTPQLGANSSFGAEMTDEHSSLSVQGMLRSTGVRLDAGQDSFLDIEESDAESLRFADDLPILQRNDENLFDKPAKAAGTPFTELVDRLLTAPMTRADNNFADVFLCLYRKFAAPHELLEAIIISLNKTWEEKGLHFLERTATQFRYIEVIARWVSLYPGDFARPASRKLLEGLIRRLTDEPIFTLSAQQIREHLDNDVAEDDDTWWAKCDDPPAGESTTPGPGAAAAGGLERESHPSESMRSLTLEDSRSSDRPSSENGSGGLGPGASFSSALSPGRGLSHFQFHSYEDYEREAATMVPMGTLPLNKFRYHIFMDMDTNEMADEITRIDWIMFSSIRIRDLVRHVSLSTQEKERCRSLKNMNRMISHFNHVARWVSNMILIRDKAKHRAPCLQKFMCIALRLRQLRNYNGLAAVLAGINGTAIHRLAQTRALVDPDIQKRFARLVLLMSTQKSHFTYRLAWENSPLPRIPFMPLHRRDLVSAEEGSRTFIGPQGDRINWKKFEVLGEVLLPIMKSQGTPYPNLKKHQPSREMVLDCRMPMDEEEIYQRSLQVEPTGGTADLKKKFPWLPK
ncbi:hypothetical protein SCUCBS95973_009214 [Sporothrix curviconia]|uniref:Ras guanyl-nucleotide exchange factor n=1 Tax=Sporothrix curviconia TaxID=1260050 RepID=A0ABP0CT52_9PEZI